MSEINYVNGDLFAEVTKIETPVVISHVVNCKGGWGSGFVVPLGRHFPLSKEKYLEWYAEGKNVDFKLGEVQFVNVSEQPQITVANMVAQTLGGKRPLFYNELAKCMDRVARYMEFSAGPGAQIVAPMFGSKLAGGDWNFVEELITDCWLKRDIPVTIFYLLDNIPDAVLIRHV